METVFTIVGIIAMMFGFAIFTHWFMEKFMGVKIHGKFQAFEAFNELQEEEEQLNQYPEILKRDAIEACKRKGHRITTTNVLAQSNKLLRRNGLKYLVTEQQMKEIDHLIMVENWQAVGTSQDTRNIEVTRVVQLLNHGKISKWDYYLELRRIFNIP